MLMLMMSNGGHLKPRVFKRFTKSLDSRGLEARENSVSHCVVDETTRKRDAQFSAVGAISFAKV
jgi:hypothetical protein